MTENTITTTEIREQIKKLQEQIASMKETAQAIIAINDTDEYDGEEPSAVVNAQIATAKIEAIKAVFIEREKTLQSLLELYKSMYSEISNHGNAV